jgi:cyanate permease
VTLGAVLGATTILPHALLLRRRPEDLGLLPDGAPPGPGPGPGPGPAHPEDARPADEVGRPGRGGTGLAVGAVLRLEGFAWLAVAFSLHSLAANGVGVHLVPYLSERGLDVGAAAALAGAVGATQILGRILFAPLEDRLPAGALTAAVLLVQPLALIVLLLARGGAGAAAFVALYGAGRGAMTLVRATTVAGRYGAARYASISGVLALCVTLAQAAGPLVAGAGHDRFGAYEPVFWGFVAVSAGAAGAALLARRPHRRRPVG